jgi:Phosphatidylinositol N-acetylglucosaminyltransferase
VSSITLGIAGVSVAVFGSVTPGGAVLLFFALFFITFGCPAVLVWAQKFKKCVVLLAVKFLGPQDLLMRMIPVRSVGLGILPYLRSGRQ